LGDGRRCAGLRDGARTDDNLPAERTCLDGAGEKRQGRRGERAARPLAQSARRFRDWNPAVRTGAPDQTINMIHRSVAIHIEILFLMPSDLARMPFEHHCS
jgi:hypothetical protein